MVPYSAISSFWMFSESRLLAIVAERTDGPDWRYGPGLDPDEADALRLKLLIAEEVPPGTTPLTTWELAGVEYALVEE